MTPERFHDTLRDLGFDSLDEHPAHYGEGLALGNGEVSLLELVGSYATLARGGLWRPLRVTLDGMSPNTVRERRVFSPEVGSIIADILADPEARGLEFGRHGILDLPVPTAVKTGTSNDYRDAWAVGFSSRFTVGVWMGNLDGREMQGVSGSIGPGLVLRAVFAELRRVPGDGPLAIDRRLGRRPICAVSGAVPGPRCPVVEEWFRPGTEPSETCRVHREAAPSPAVVPGPEIVFRLSRPTRDLLLAMDPRIPDELEAFDLAIEGDAPVRETVWYVDGLPVGTTGPGVNHLAWGVRRGDHVAHARVWSATNELPVETPKVTFRVK